MSEIDYNWNDVENGSSNEVDLLRLINAEFNWVENDVEASESQVDDAEDETNNLHEQLNERITKRERRFKEFLYNGTWNPYVRDIDPTILISCMNKGESNFFSDIYQIPENDLDEWVHDFQDLPSLESIAFIHRDEKEYILLCSHINWLIKGDEEIFSQRKELFIKTFALMVPIDKINEYSKIKEVYAYSYSRHWEDIHTIFGREFYWHPADLNKYLMQLNGKDKTSDVLSYSINESKVNVKFLSNAKNYKYDLENVFIKENPIVIDITYRVVYFKDIPLNDIKQILDFGVKIRVIFNKGNSQIYDSESIRVEKNCLTNEAAKNILEYWKEISQFTNADNESKAFLNKEYERLTFVSPNSVLGCYLNNQNIKALPHSLNNIIFPFKFNLSQKKALDNALESSISVIEGPPGTGKTQTILNILANLAVMQDQNSSYCVRE